MSERVRATCAAGVKHDMSIFEFVEMLQLCGIVPHHVHENDVRFCDRVKGTYGLLMSVSSGRGVGIRQVDCVVGDGA